MPRRPPRLASVSPVAVLLACWPFATLATNPANDAAGSLTLSTTQARSLPISAAASVVVVSSLVFFRIPHRGVPIHGLHSDVYFPHGGSLSRHDVGDFSLVSNIDAVHQLRLHELWLQRKFGKTSLRLGLIAAELQSRRLEQCVLENGGKCAAAACH